MASVDRPLWQTLFLLSAAAFVAAAAGMGWVIHDAEGGPGILPALYVVQALAAFSAGAGALLERSWALGAVLAAGALFLISVLIEHL